MKGNGRDREAAMDPFRFTNLHPCYRWGNLGPHRLRLVW